MINTQQQQAAASTFIHKHEGGWAMEIIAGFFISVAVVAIVYAFWRCLRREIDLRLRRAEANAA